MVKMSSKNRSTSGMKALIVLLFALINLANYIPLTLGDNDSQDSLLWIFNPEGQLRWDSPAGTFVQFDGPMRISPSVSQNKSVTLQIAEPFLLRQHFQISPSGPLSPGQPFKLQLIRPLSRHQRHSSLDSPPPLPLKLTLQAQLLPTPMAAVDDDDAQEDGDSNNNNNNMLLRVERKELAIRLVGSERPFSPHQLFGAEEKMETEQYLQQATAMVDETDCSMLKINISPLPGNLGPDHYSSFQLLGPLADQFVVLFSPGQNDEFIKIRHNNNGSNSDNNKSLANASCAPEIGKDDLSLLGTLPGPFGSSQLQIWSLEGDEDKKHRHGSTGLHFVQRQFHLQFNAERRSLISPQLVLLAHVEPLAKALDEASCMEFTLLEEEDQQQQTSHGNESGNATAVVTLDPRSGAFSIGNVEKLLAEFEEETSAGDQQQKKTIHFVVALVENGTIVDRANIGLDLVELTVSGKDEKIAAGRRRKNKKKKPRTEMVRFEKSIYAFAIDPYEKIGSQQQIAIARLGTRPKMVDEEEEEGGDWEDVHFVVSEGGGGMFQFADAAVDESQNGSSSSSMSRDLLLYNGPMSQFPRNYTLKLLLLSGPDFVDTAIVHVLVSGIGSAAPVFQNKFQRVLVPKNSQKFGSSSINSTTTTITDAVVDDQQTLFTLSAEDTDPDAHLVYALEGVQCQDLSAEAMPDCQQTFSLSPNGTGQWVLSLIDTGGDEKMDEALVNISVQDRAHPLEEKGHTLVLLKFVQQPSLMNGSSEVASGNDANNNNNDNSNSAFHFAQSLINRAEGLVLQVRDSTPPNALIYSFGLPANRATRLRYSLVGSNRHRKYFNIGRESGILTTALPVRQIVGRHQFTVEVQINGSRSSKEHFPFTVEIVPSSSSSSNNTDVGADEFYEIVMEENGGGGGEAGMMMASLLGNWTSNGTNSSSTTTTIELLFPMGVNGSTERMQIPVEAGSSNSIPINFTSIMERMPVMKQAAADDDGFGAEIFVHVHSTGNNGRQLSMFPLHIDMPKQRSSFSSSSARLLTPLLPDIPILLAEHSPIGTFVFSLDFDSIAPSAAKLRVQPLFQDEEGEEQHKNGSSQSAPMPPSLSSPSSLFKIEKRATNLILLRTNRPLRGMARAAPEAPPMQFALILLADNEVNNNNGTEKTETKATRELGQFAVQIVPAISCEPRFKADQALSFQVEEQSLLQLTDSSSLVTQTQWLPIGMLSAEMDPLAKGCEQLKYRLDRVGIVRSVESVEQLGGIRVDPLTGLLSANAAILSHFRDDQQQWERRPIPLEVSVHSGPAFSARVRLQLQIVPSPQPSSSIAPPQFVGGGQWPLLLQIEEGAPAGTLLTTLKAKGMASRDRDYGGNRTVKYRLEGPDTDLLEFGAHSGELKTRTELDYEALARDRQLPLRMLAIAEWEREEDEMESVGDGHGQNRTTAGEMAMATTTSELEVQLDLVDINDNNPVFGRDSYDFVVEKNAPVGQLVGHVEAGDADQCTEQVDLLLLACTFHFGTFSRQMAPPTRHFHLDSQSGEITLASSVDDSPGGRFSLQVLADDGQGRRSVLNATVNIWIVDSSDIVSIVVNKSPAELDGEMVAEYLRSLASATGIRPLLHEVRYHPISSRADGDGNGVEDGDVVRRSALLQTIFLDNQTRVMTYEQAEMALKDAHQLAQGMDSFEQNIFCPSSSSSHHRRATAADNQAAASSSSISAHLLPMSLFFLFLLVTVLAVLSVLCCQHRRRHITRKHLAEALRQINASKGGSSEMMHKIGGGGAGAVNGAFAAYFMAAAAHQQKQIWRRPLPLPPPPPPAILPLPPPHHLIAAATPSSVYGGVAHSQRPSTEDYYTVQEMKIAL